MSFRCYSTLCEMANAGYSQAAKKLLFGSGSCVVPDTLPFTHADLALPINERKTRKNSISGVQEKVALKFEKGGFSVDDKGDFILKPIPTAPKAVFCRDIPANEHLTMQIARQIFKIDVAANAIIPFSDGEFAYITKRFDRRNGESIPQEDFCQLSGRSEESHGSHYKYNASYEEVADIVREYCSAYRVELPKLFYRILFNYVIANGDAHLKNFSVCQSPFGDYVLSPAYDLLNTLLHFPNEMWRTALDLFKDGDSTTPEFEALGYYTEPDFVKLGASFGVSEGEVYEMVYSFHRNKQAVEGMIERSFLSPEAKVKYREIFNDRLLAFRKTKERFEGHAASVETAHGKEDPCV